MSDFTAIAGVSSTLRTLLLDRMQDWTDSPVLVTVAPPDVTLTGAAGRRVNLYLYQITENGYLKNQEIPGQGQPGAYGHPPLSLDLYYMVTAYGESDTGLEGDLHAQQILADAMRVLHDFPTITGELTITRPRAGVIDTPILNPSLQNEFERIKIILQPTTLEDFSKIWTALPETNFRRSVAYQVSVVQIESQRPRRLPKPVGEPPAAGPRVYAVPFLGPQIREVSLRRPGDPPDTERRIPYAAIGDTLIIRGRNLSSENTRVFLGEVDVTAQATTMEEDYIELNIPDHAALQPGPQTVKVVVDVVMDESGGSHINFTSNLGVFMLVPHINELVSDFEATPATLQVNGTRLYHDDLECMVLIRDTGIHSDSYTTSTATTIEFNLPESLASGDYPVRIRVNNFEDVNNLMLNIP